MSDILSPQRLDLPLERLGDLAIDLVGIQSIVAPFESVCFEGQAEEQPQGMTRRLAAAPRQCFLSAGDMQGHHGHTQPSQRSEHHHLRQE